MSAAGRWNITLNTPMGPQSGVLELVAEGSTLTGWMSNGEHRIAVEDGRADGERLTWSAKLTKPMRMNLKITASVTASSIEGEARHLLGRAKFSGTRVG